MSRRTCKTILLLALTSKIAFVSSAEAKIRKVPAEYSTIQAAINAASAGDTVLVEAGIYFENILVSKDAIFLLGSNGSLATPADTTDDTIIDGRKLGRTVSLVGSEGAALSGFTIRNGEAGGGEDFNRGGNVYCKNSCVIIMNNLITQGSASRGPGYGGGIYFSNSIGTIQNNVITENFAWGAGGGLYVVNSNPTIINNRISDNIADAGAGIYCVNASPMIKKNVIAHNFADFEDGGGIICNSSSAAIENNTIVDNRAGQFNRGQGGAIYLVGTSIAILRNNIIAFNSADNSTGGVYCAGAATTSTFFYNNIFGNDKGDLSGCQTGVGALSADPLFIDRANRNYALAAQSPSIDTGDPNVAYNDEDGTRNDMGAFGGTLKQLDSDEDGLSDFLETVYGTSVVDTDSDDDGALDGEEVCLYRTKPVDVDSDNDNFDDGVEIENETNPNDASSLPEPTVSMTFDKLVDIAFGLSQKPFIEPYIQSISDLDPPGDFMDNSIGLVFQESNRISARNLFDNARTYAYARPRAALDKHRFQVYIDDDNNGNYDLKTYAHAKFDYSHPMIVPPIRTKLLPIAAKVLTRFIVGQEQSTSNFPQFFDFSAIGYARFNGYLPQTVGASYRVALHRVFTPNESFPRFRRIFFSATTSSRTSQLMALMDSEGFTGAVKYEMTPDTTSQMHVVAKIFPRSDIPLAEEFGLVGFSSMFWQDEEDTPEDSTDEAHDSDRLVVAYDRDNDGIIDIIKEKKIDNPFPGARVVTNFELPANGTVKYFALENRDRNAKHYSKFGDASYETRSSYSVEVLSSSLPLSLILHEDSTRGEYNDNIVAHLAVRAHVPKAQTSNNAVSLEYLTRAYFPIDTDGDSLTDQLEHLAQTNAKDTDTDDDGISDYRELLNGTNPKVEVEERDVEYSGEGLPQTFQLHQNYPNPFNPETVIRFDLPASRSKNVNVRLTIYNLSGELVRVLLEESRVAGSHSVIWDGKDSAGFVVPSGVYFYKIVAGHFEATRKALLLR